MSVIKFLQIIIGDLLNKKRSKSIILYPQWYYHNCIRYKWFSQFLNLQKEEHSRNLNTVYRRVKLFVGAPSLAKIRGVVGGAQVRKMRLFFSVYLSAAKHIRGNVDEEDGGYLQMGGMEGLVTLVQSNMKLAKPYAC